MARNKSVKTSSSASGTTSKPLGKKGFFRGSSTPKQTFLPREREREERRKEKKARYRLKREKKRGEKKKDKEDSFGQGQVKRCFEERVCKSETEARQPYARITFHPRLYRPTGAKSSLLVVVSTIDSQISLYIPET